MSFKCPKNTGLYCDESSEPRRQVEQPTSGEVYRSGRVNGISVADFVLDTGASRTLVREDLVPSCAIRNGDVAIRCAHGNAMTYPLAEITISVGVHEELTVQAAISKTLPAAVLLGRDVPELMTLLGTKTGTQKPTTGDPVLVLATTTQAQARTQQQESQTEEHMHVSGATPSKPVFSEEETSDSEGMAEFEFHSFLFSRGREKPRLSRSEKRRARREYVPDLHLPTKSHTHWIFQPKNCQHCRP